MKKSIYDLAMETVNPAGGVLTENQENEVDALVQFGKLVLENSSLPTQRAADELCPNCGKDYFVEETIIDGELQCNSCAKSK